MSCSRCGAGQVEAFTLVGADRSSSGWRCAGCGHFVGAGVACVCDGCLAEDPAAVAVAMAAAGATREAIAMRVERSTRTVSRWLDAAEAPRRRRGPPESAARARGVEMLAAGSPPAAVAAAVGVSLRTAQRWAAEVH